MTPVAAKRYQREARTRNAKPQRQTKHPSEDALPQELVALDPRTAQNARRMQPPNWIYEHARKRQHG
eukprot:1114894-Pyramimonas_sp.AAC.1